jgi:uncharacterized protein DUF4149
MNFFRMLSLILWLGGIVFFGAVLAPTVFSILPERQLAGAVVNHALTKLHYIGLACGCAYLIASLIQNRIVHGEFRPVQFSHLAIILMMALTAASQFVVMPRMDTLRREMGVIDQTPFNDPRRLEFDRLHQRSTQLEGGVLLLGLMVTWGLARKIDN